ncbi:MAG TPA: TetR/AcrR family transcriptional regulator [Dehalococcoidia bacterium]|jgi:AcrR family transcriptional regulator
MPRTTIDRFEQRKLTRAKLVDAALQLFSTSGYEHATVDDIAQAAGYSKGAYYFHFSTKDDILLELLRMWTEERGATLTAGAEFDAPTADAVRDMLAGFFSYAEAPQWPGVLLEFWAQAVRHPEVSRRLTAAYATWRKQLTGAFERAAEAGVVNVASAEDAAAVALAAHDGYAVQTVIGSPGGRAMTAAELADTIVTPLETSVAGERRSVAI